MKDESRASKQRRPVAQITEAALADDLAALIHEFVELHMGLEESGGMAGSLGEWMVERMDEIETELRKRRTQTAVQP